MEPSLAKLNSYFICFMQFVSQLVSCNLFLVIYFMELFPVFCFVSFVSFNLFHIFISCNLFHVFCFMQFVSRLSFHTICFMQLVSCHFFPEMVSCYLFRASCFISHVSYRANLMRLPSVLLTFKITSFLYYISGYANKDFERRWRLLRKFIKFNQQGNLHAYA